MASEDNEVSYLEMSDEDLANVDPNTVGQASASTSVEEEEDTDAGMEANEGAKRTEEADNTQSVEQEKVVVEGSTDDSEDKEESNPEDKSVELDTGKTADKPIDFEAAYKQLTAPFKANGREIQVNSVEDAVSLMQMGANYNKKMAALKPSLKLMKLLENNGLLNEDKISYLIDLEKRNPEAINKLVKDSGLDPLELDTEKANDYKPTKHTVDDREIELDGVLDEIQESPSYNKTLDIVSNKWDGSSKQVIANNPQLLKVINSHVQSGIYDQINTVVENERLFGRLSGLSDIEAYRQVGDMIQASGGFSHLGTQGHQTQPKPVVVEPKPKMGDEDKRREKKVAAGITAAVAPSKTSMEFNPLSLSDDEFAKLINKQFL